MEPDKNSNSQGGTSLSQQGSFTNGWNQTGQNYEQNQAAAANIIRTQLDNIYDSQNKQATSIDKTPSIAQPSLEYGNPYERNHTEHPRPQASDWKQYHTAWQNYYQQYYEGYYKHVLKTERTKKNCDDNEKYFTAGQPETKEPTNEDLVYDMRQKLVGKVRESATKIRKSKHFIPLTAGLIVILFFAFLQYNRLLISNVVAYVSPGSIDPQNIVVDPNADVLVGPEPRLIIPKINVDVPVLYDVGNDNKSQLAAMTKGVAQFSIPGASSHPGEIGNTVIAGHSSNDLFDQGDYKFIFAQLEKLQVGDTIFANYKSKRYTYTVTKTEVVRPSDVSKLVYPTTKPVLTLITCVPLGTALNRLLVTADQVSPDPNTSTQPADTETKTASIPGNSPTFFERLFGG